MGGPGGRGGACSYLYGQPYGICRECSYGPYGPRGYGIILLNNSICDTLQSSITSDSIDGTSIIRPYSPTIAINNIKENDNNLNCYFNYPIYYIKSFDKINSITIYDIKGNQVKQFNNNNALLNLKELAFGIYTINISIGEKHLNKMLFLY